MSKHKININQNSFDYLKIFSAYCVVLVHIMKYAITTVPSELSYFLRELFLCVPSVLIFFTISGFLVSASLDQSKNKKIFIQKRFSRIFPPLWISVIIYSIFYLIFMDVDLITFCKFFINFLGIGYTPSSFKILLTESFNGALWTIFVIIQFYIFLIIFNKKLKSLSTNKWILLLLFSYFMNILLGFITNPTIHSILSRSIFPYIVFFLVGSFGYYHASYIIPFLKKYVYLLLFVYLVYCLLGRPYKSIGFYSPFLTSLITPFITIGLAYRLGNHRIKHEFSYSLYLYHWLFINFSMMLPKIFSNLFLFLFFVLFFSTISAIAAYYFVEERTLKKIFNNRRRLIC